MKASFVEVRAVELDVGEVPLAGPRVALPGSAAVGIPIPIGPRRFVGDIVRREGVLIFTKDYAQLGARRRFEILLGDEGDDLMTLIPHASAC
jgi:hypothetical protein